MTRRKIKIESEQEMLNFIQQARKVHGEVDVERGSITIDGKSILGVFHLDLAQPCAVVYPNDAVAFGAYLKQFEIG